MKGPKYASKLLQGTSRLMEVEQELILPPQPPMNVQLAGTQQRVRRCARAAKVARTQLQELHNAHKSRLGAMLPTTREVLSIQRQKHMLHVLEEPTPVQVPPCARPAAQVIMRAA